MKNFIIRTLEGIDEKEVLKVFNTAFSDYSVPVNISSDQFTSKIKSENIDFKYSTGAFLNDKLVGFILHGTKVIGNSLLCYNGGTGVIPSQRGNGLTVKMYKYIIPKFRKRKVDKIFLEVLTENEAAIKSYDKLGFKRVRTFNCYKGDITINSSGVPIEVKLLENTNLEDLVIMGDSDPSWQNAMEAIKKLPNTKVVGAYMDAECVGYCIINMDNFRIIQMAVKQELRRQKIGSNLLSYIEKNISKQVSINNVEVNHKGANRFLIKTGMQNILQQYEMILKI